MTTDPITPRPDDSTSPTTGACCSFCGLPSGNGRALVESPEKTAYLCGDCALKSTYVIFAHKQTLAHKLVLGLIPLGIFFALGGALIAYFLEEGLLIEPHIAMGLIVLGFLCCQILHFWWPNDDLLPRRPWF